MNDIKETFAFILVNLFHYFLWLLFVMIFFIGIKLLKFLETYKINFKLIGI